MQCVVDLRYVVPPLIILTLTVQTSQDKSWAQDAYLGAQTLALPASVITYLFLLLVILAFLFTSVELPLKVEPIYLRVRRFSSPLTLSLVSSVFLPPSSFWIIFPILLVMSPWYPVLLDLLVRFMGCVSRTIQAIPALNIFCVFQRQEEVEPPPRQVEIELNEIEM